MCGIFCSLRASYGQGTISRHDEDAFHVISDKLKRANAARGPDARNATSIDFPIRTATRSSSEISKGHILELYASELRLRGNAPIVQPHIEGGDVLCWNGEVFEGLEIGPTENDGQKVFGHFQVARDAFSISEIIANIEGPYAFVFHQGSSKKLYFARDPLGRRSLLIHKPTRANPIFLLASVSVGDDDACDFEELSTDGVYVLDLDSLREPENFVTDFRNNLVVVPRASGEHLPFGVISKVNRSLPPDNLLKIQGLDAIIPPPLLEAVEQFIIQLDRSVMLRVRNIPYAPGDGGNAKVAVLFSGGIDSTILAFLAHRHISLDEPIDLLNVAFENPRKVQLRLDSNSGALPRKWRRQHSEMNEIESNGNVNGETSSYMVPDRETGLQEVEELRILCPGRAWNFVEVDVPYEDSRAARSTVEAIMYPSRTVMDLSLAFALFFASRGKGRVRDAPTLEYRTYESPAKVVLSGLGSDELLGGYSRHRTNFTAKGWGGVIDELQLELDRIPTRNLGRDDRVISSHGKETRHPFLSLSVVSFLAGLPVHLKVDPRLDIGIGDKMLLRLAARRLGLVEASMRRKRAMQFGSHSARMEGGEGERRGDLMVN